VLRNYIGTVLTSLIECKQVLIKQLLLQYIDNVVCVVWCCRYSSHRVSCLLVNMMMTGTGMCTGAHSRSVATVTLPVLHGNQHSNA